MPRKKTEKVKEGVIPIIRPSIPADEVTIENIVAGVIVRLGRREVFWKLPSGKVELNAFKGKITAEVKGKFLTENEQYDVLSGIKCGRIMVVDAMITTEPPNTKWLLSEYAPRARRLLDCKDEEFINALRRNFSHATLETALELEKEGKNRDDRVKLLTEKIIDIRGK